MKVLHLSDTHGFPFWERDIPSDVELVVHTGDLILDMGWGTADVFLETSHAIDSLREIAPLISNWLQGRHLIYVPGNHDFAELMHFLPQAYRVDETTLININGKTFSGYAGIPYIYGKWNHELSSDVLRLKLAEALSNNPDVLITHCGPSGILSNGPNKEVYGCKTQASILNGSGFGNVKHHLFGHIHCGPAIANIAGICFSNAAGDPKASNGNILDI